MATPAIEASVKEEDVLMTEPSGVSNPKEIKNALYARCASLEEDHVFDQEELLSFNVIPNNDVAQLLKHSQQLAKEGLFKVMTKNGKICWRVVNRKEAAKYKSFSQEEALVYGYIEAAQREGIWSKQLRSKTNLHMTSMNRAVKSLEAKNYIKSIQTVKFPNRKTYMLARLQPSEDVTGGPFYSDGVLDEEFVYQMSYWAERYVIGRSWRHPPLQERSGKKAKSEFTQEQAEELRAGALRGQGAGRDRSQVMLPMPPGYNGYPTLSEVTKAINASKVSGIVMKEAEVGQLLDILCWDGKLEKVRDGKAFRAVRQVFGESDIENGIGNGLTESPCGRCPVFDLCEEGGPVNAGTCEYFEDWLLP